MLLLGDIVDERQNRVSRYLVFAHRAYQHYLSKQLKMLDLSTSDCSPLLHLYHYEEEAKEGMSQAQISEQTGIDKGLLTRSIKRLSSKGLVKVAENPRNRSGKLISLTKKGRGITAQVDAIVRAWEDEMLDAVDPSNVEPFLQACYDMRLKMEDPSVK